MPQSHKKSKQILPANQKLFASLKPSSPAKCWQQLYEVCEVCPKQCRVNRNAKQLGFCQTDAALHIARAALHAWEEPPLSGASGSGTIFFTGCNLSCVFCQNCAISTSTKRPKLKQLGKEFSCAEFVETCFDLEKSGACNINLVTAAHQLPALVPALYKAKEKGLKIPIVYNSSSYESSLSLNCLKGLIDIYLPDLKLYRADLAARYLGASDYLAVSLQAVSTMFEQVGAFEYYKTPPTPFSKASKLSPLLRSGMIIRILLLPNCLNEAKALLSWAYTQFKDQVIFSLMNQYTPISSILRAYPELDRHVLAEEYKEFVEFALDMGVKYAFTQAASTQTTSFIPDFQMYNDAYND